MNLRVRYLLLSIFFLVLSPLVGMWIAKFSLLKIFVLLLIMGGLFFVKFADYPFLLALGLSLPHNLPLPMIWALPTYFVLISLCLTHKFLQLSMGRTKALKLPRNISIWFYLFFIWVFFRYLQDPALPRFFSQDDVGVTGFKAFFEYFSCAVITLSLPILIDTREKFHRFLKWMAIFAFFFIILLSIGSFTSSLALVKFYHQIGFTPNYQPGSTLRFVALPNYGFFLISLLYLRKEFKLGQGLTAIIMVCGLIALVLGSNRTTVVQLIGFLFVILLLRKKMVQIYLSGVALCLFLVLSYYIGENYDMPTEYQFVRILSLASPRVSRETDAQSNVQWRLVRWERAMQDIRDHPVLGVGYGGMQGIFRLLSYTEQIDEDTRIEMDLATGSSHNALISGARALGIPAVVLFLSAWFYNVYFHYNRFKRSAINSYYYQHASWLLAILLSLLVSMQTSYDLNSIRLWMYLAISELFREFYFRGLTTQDRSATGSSESNTA